MTLRNPECTCAIPSGEHSLNCDLWDDDDFSSGRADWDSASRQLLPLIDLSDEVTEILGTKTETVSTGEVYSWDETEWLKQWGTECYHYQTEFNLPSGVTLYASRLHDHDPQEGDIIPDMGCYLSPSWIPDTIAYHIGWEDLGLPYIPIWQVLYIARDLMRLARDDFRVEIGCIGGHGRTGTMLAIMVMMDEPGLTHEQAIQYVRHHYCSQAIETVEQEKWLYFVREEILKNVTQP